MARALITGITGQDGYYLSELLRVHGYEVYGLIHGQRNPKSDEVRQRLPHVQLIHGDVEDLSSLIAAVELSQPDEVYNFAGISFVPFSFSQPELTANITGLGVIRLLQAIRIVGGPDTRTRLYQASTSDMFGAVDESPQTESTAFRPVNPYAASKLFAHNITRAFRFQGMFAACGISYNHESPHRSLEFVPRKVTNGVARIKLGLDSTLAMGDLDARRDWGFAGDYVRAMWLMLQQDEPDDFIIATGISRTVRELVDTAFRVVGIDDWERYVTVDPRFMRPTDVVNLVGDPSKARDKLGWTPEVSFEEMIEQMVEYDLKFESQKTA